MAKAVPQAPKTVAASINFSSIVTTSPRVENRFFTTLMCAVVAFVKLKQVILSWIAIAVLGIARKRGIFIFTISPISEMSTPVTTETKMCLVVNSFLKLFNTSLTWYGFTARITNSLLCTASALLDVTLTPIFFKFSSVTIFLFVIVISEALQNLLFNNPSAIAVPKFPPPIMAIFLFILFHSLIVAKMHQYKNIFMQKYIRIDTIHEFTFSFYF